MVIWPQKDHPPPCLSWLLLQQDLVEILDLHPLFAVLAHFEACFLGLCINS